MNTSPAPQFVSAEDLANLQPPPDVQNVPSSKVACLSIVQALQGESERLMQFSPGRDYQSGEIIFREGDPGDAMYLILAGKVVVYKGPCHSPTILGYRVSGESVGEMALLDQQPRSASVVALTAVRLQIITQENFPGLMEISPQLSLSLMKLLSARLRESSTNLYRLRRMVDNLQTDMGGLQETQEALRQANEQLTTQLEEVRALEARLQEMAIRDGLTGLYNRRYLDDALKRELERSRRELFPLSLIIMDIDHFKKFNDTHGHQAGDQVLRELGKLLQNHTRRDDVACRYGGEEFLIILPGADLESARKRAETLRLAFANLPVEYDGKILRATLSLGVAAFPDHGSEAEQVIQAADGALYAAKNAGRNRVMVCKD